MAITGQPYSYAGDDPVDLIDPTGQSGRNPFSWSASTWEVVGVAAAVTAGAVALCIATGCIGDAAVGAAALGGADAVDAGAAAGAAVDAGAATETGTTVIASYAASPSYIDVAESLGANYFNVDAETWAAMTADDQWAANQSFLDEAIARGDTFALSSPPELAQEGTAYYSELQYILQNGYTISGDTLVPAIEEGTDILPIFPALSCGSQ